MSTPWDETEAHIAAMEQHLAFAENVKACARANRDAREVKPVIPKFWTETLREVAAEVSRGACWTVGALIVIRLLKR